MTNEKREWIDQHLDGEGALVADGFDDCIRGIVRIFNRNLVLYDTEKVIDKLEQQGMTHDEAIEYFEFNIVGAYMGEGTPGFAIFYDENERAETKPERPDL